ncbi:hypothetical protein BJX76DRAFT_297617 [Aspergillus varians]
MYPFILPFLLFPLTSSFTLDTKSTYWRYTTSSLTNTTSQTCKEAYSAEIACDEYLVTLVNANEDRHFLPSMTQSNFTNTCTKTCHSSLATYITNVEKACTEPGDAALKGVGVWGEMKFTKIPVATIGRIFEYTLMRSCAEDETGENCYISQSSIIPSKFSCSWACAVAYWYNQHEYPYSEWQFGSTEGRGVEIEYDADGNERPVNRLSDVLVQHAVFSSQMDGAWRIAEGCVNGSVSFKTGIEGVELGVGDETAVKVGTNESSGSGSGGSSNGTTSSTSSDSEGSGAVRIRAAGGWLVMVFMSGLVFLM